MAQLTENDLDYPGILKRSGVGYTPHRLAVLKAVGRSSHPVRVQDVLEALRPDNEINRVTVYRILSLLVEKNLVERLSSGDRSFRYGLSPQVGRGPHAHFYCTRCGNMECLNPEVLELDTRRLERTLSGVIDKVEIRLDGTCGSCLQKSGR